MGRRDAKRAAVPPITSNKNKYAALGTPTESDAAALLWLARLWVLARDPR
jgi:hypothetical protein